MRVVRNVRTQASRSENGTPLELAHGLAGVFADTYAVYLMTQGSHWNVEGREFYSLHRLFEKQYRKLGDALDSIAEQIRQEGFYAPATFSEITRLTSIELAGDVPDVPELLSRLIAAHAKVLDRLHAVLQVAEAPGAESVWDLLADRAEAHEQAIWMLRSSQGGKQSRALAA
jgi:starvation-inducible DNA-binding protein